jgi:hypothetical protein
MLVDDSSETFAELFRQYSGLPQQIEISHHRMVLDELAGGTTAPAFFARYGLVLVDAYWVDRNSAVEETGIHTDRDGRPVLPASRFAALDVVQAMRHLPPGARPPAVVYSVRMDRPKVNIPLWELPWWVKARYRTRELLATLDDGSPVLSHITAGAYPLAWHDPTDDDHRALGLARRPGLSLSGLLRGFQDDPRLWYQAVTNHTPPGHKPATVSKAITRLAARHHVAKGSTTRVVNLVRQIAHLNPMRPPEPGP